MKAPENALELLAEGFAPELVLQREGGRDRKTGKVQIFRYVNAETVLQRLHDVFGIDFDIRVPGIENGLQNFILTAGSKTEVVVCVELNYTGTDGERHSRTGFGSKDLLGTDLGGAFKAAKSKALTNAAKALGVPIDGGEAVDEDDEELEEGTDYQPIEEKPKASKPARPDSEKAGPAKPERAAAKPARPATAAKDEEEEPEEKPARSAKPARPSKPAPEPEPEPEEEEGDGEEAEVEYNADGEPLCSECGDAILEMTDDDNRTWTPEELVELTVTDLYGRPVCAGCMAEMDGEE